MLASRLEKTRDIVIKKDGKEVVRICHLKHNERPRIGIEADLSYRITTEKAKNPADRISRNSRITH